MSVSRETIAHVAGVDPKDVRCEKCKSYQNEKYSFEVPYCAFLGIPTFKENFCSFWRGYVRIKR